MKYYITRPQCDGIMIEGLDRKLNGYELLTKEEIENGNVNEDYMYNTLAGIPDEKIYFKYDEHIRFTNDQIEIAKIRANDHGFYR